MAEGSMPGMECPDCEMAMVEGRRRISVKSRAIGGAFIGLTVKKIKDQILMSYSKNYAIRHTLRNLTLVSVKYFGCMESCGFQVKLTDDIFVNCSYIKYRVHEKSP